MFSCTTSQVISPTVLPSISTLDGLMTITLCSFALPRLFANLNRFSFADKPMFPIIEFAVNPFKFFNPENSGSISSLNASVRLSISLIGFLLPFLMFSAMELVIPGCIMSRNAPFLAGENGRKSRILDVTLPIASVTLLIAPLIPSAIDVTMFFPAFLKLPIIFLITLSAPLIPFETAFLTPLIAPVTMPFNELNMLDMVLFIPLTTDVIVDLMPFQMVVITLRTAFITVVMFERIALNTEVTTDFTAFTTVVITLFIPFQTVDITLLIVFQTVDVTDLIAFQTIVMTSFIELNSPLANDLTKFQIVVKTDFIPFHTVDVTDFIVFQTVVSTVFIALNTVQIGRASCRESV